MKKIICVFVITVFLLSLFGIESSAYYPGEILYHQDFSDPDSVTSSLDYKVVGDAYFAGDSEVKFEDNTLRIVSAYRNADNQYYKNKDSKDSHYDIREGTRVLLYKIPGDVSCFSVEVNLKINEFFEGGNSSTAAGVVLADNGLSDSLYGAMSSKYDVLLLRPYLKGTTGVHNFGNNYGSGSAKDSGICTEGAFYVKALIDSGEGLFHVTNKATGETNNDSNCSFMYNTSHVDRMIGLYAGGADVSFESITIRFEDGSHISGTFFDYNPEPATEPITEPVTEPATEPATEPETEPVTEPATEPVTEPATEPKTEPATETADTDPPAIEEKVDNITDSVLKAGAVDSNTGIDKEQENKSNTGLIIGIIAAVVVVCAAVVAFLLARKKKK